jgi:hypothetical protein
MFGLAHVPPLNYTRIVVSEENDFRAYPDLGIWWSPEGYKDEDRYEPYIDEEHDYVATYHMQAMVTVINFADVFKRGKTHDSMRDMLDAQDSTAVFRAVRIEKRTSFDTMSTEDRWTYFTQDALHIIQGGPSVARAFVKAVWDLAQYWDLDQTQIPAHIRDPLIEYGAHGFWHITCPPNPDISSVDWVTGVGMVLFNLPVRPTLEIAAPLDEWDSPPPSPAHTRMPLRF